MHHGIDELAGLKAGTHIIDGMFQVCPGCQRWVSRFDVDVRSSRIVCPDCGTGQAFAFRPLRVLLGASGSGKSTVARQLVGKDPRRLVLDLDILWAPEFDDPDSGYRRFRETWLRLAANVHQGGIDTLLVGSGVPDQFEVCDGRSFFSASRYAALVCSDDQLRQRLRSRPAWRSTSDPATIERMLEYNDWLKREGPRAAPSVTLFDTSEAEIQETARLVTEWSAQPDPR